MKIKGKGKPPSGDYQVFEIKDKTGTIAYTTVYGDGRRTFEFDSDEIYTEAEVVEILDLARKSTV